MLSLSCVSMTCFRPTAVKQVNLPTINNFFVWALLPRYERAWSMVEMCTTHQNGKTLQTARSVFILHRQRVLLFDATQSNNKLF